MEQSIPDILVVHVSPGLSGEAGPFQRGARIRPPLGAWCLAAALPGTVRVFDAQDRPPAAWDASDVGRSPRRAVIVQAPHLDWDSARQFGQELARLFPEVPHYLAGPSPEVLAAPWRGLIQGSGWRAMTALLAGETPEGVLTADDSLVTGLPHLPEGPVAAVTMYEGGAETILAGPTLPVAQPCLGLAEERSLPGPLPDPPWFSRFLEEAGEAGFLAVHWRRSCFDRPMLAWLREMHEERGLGLSMTWADAASLPPVAAFPERVPWRVWLTPPLPGQGDIALFARAVEAFQADGGRLGFRLEPDHFVRPELWPLLSHAEEIRLRQAGTWPVSLRRSLVWHFYLRLGRFPGKLFRLRSGYQLLRLLRQLYGILDAVMR